MRTHFHFQELHQYAACAIAVAGLCIWAGCASTDTKTETKSESSPPAKSESPPPAPQKTAQAPPLPPGVTLRPERDTSGVWLADGFDFHGYGALYIRPIVFDAVVRPNEAETRTKAIQYLGERVYEELIGTGLFPQVTMQTNNLQTDVHTLRLNMIITEYEKGGGGARYWAGLFGAGQPVIKVRGIVQDGDKVMCVFEMRRSGDSGDARMSGAYMSDVDIQRQDIDDLARDLTGFVKRTAKLPEPARHK